MTLVKSDLDYLGIFLLNEEEKKILSREEWFEILF